MLLLLNATIFVIKNMGMQPANAITDFDYENVKEKISAKLYPALIGLCLLPFVSPAVALSTGIILSLAGFRHQNSSKYTSLILQTSIVLLGFGMELDEVIAVSKSGFSLTMISVTIVMITGILLGKLFKANKNTALLIATGTAICGGSAIAAVAPIIKSKDHENSFALIVVFVLNAAALLIFPFIGHQLHLSQEVFGNWAAIAIHDTSSVVGAGALYGPEALKTATTVKLIRALWIIPLSLVMALFIKGNNKKSIRFPWFILLFVLSILFANLFPQLQTSYAHFSWLGQRGLVVALFLIGSNITFAQIKQSGLKSFSLGITLWAITAVGSLIFLMQ
ncbi:putative integral membrane protein (TIGR00698 family) [Marinilabilia salmonicolor]|uniref:Putative integral membrane protein (TIGR00698 family) n=2 Tax=Marinilabilia salmonicolor TaxID=989 RepID=A0A2T0XM84_9BACT|nr:putative integral membrane protein (TIGR00698 family) [Marinilabilia salmonicolor]RCW38685.1 putative integral membrane protein (TIGR00698 family) [Marinilabilia salmonicolor]